MNLFYKRTEELMSTLQLFNSNCKEEVESLAIEINSVFQSGHSLFLCGNGGSASDAQHFAAELISSFGMGLSRKSLPAISLGTDTSVISAIANDFGFELVFSRQLEGLGNSGDALLAISTSGKSMNCLKAFETAKSMGIKCLALTRRGSELYKLADLAVGIPSNNTQHIQECHILTYHIISEIVESMVQGSK